VTNSTELVEVRNRLSPEAASLLFSAIDRQVESAATKYGMSQYAKMWLAGLDEGDRIRSKPVTPYSEVELVYTCINKLIAGVAAMPPVFSTIDEKIIESGPVYDILLKNPATTWDRFVSDSIGFYCLYGEVFWVFTNLVGTSPKEIRVVSPLRMTPITDNHLPDGELLGWEFHATGGQHIPLSLFEVYQWKGFNPNDRHRGIGPLKAAANNINYSFAAALYNASTLANGAEPGVILTAPGNLDTDRLALLRSQFDSRHRGAGQAKRTAVLTGGLDLKTVTMSMADMEVAEITQLTDKKICSTFGVPPGVAGLVTEAQYSHGPAMRDFIFNTIIPLASVFAANITSGILSRFYNSDVRGVEYKDATVLGNMRTFPLRRRSTYCIARQKAIGSQQRFFLWFDIYQHPVVQEAKQAEAEKVLKYTQAGISLNDLIEAHDLPYQTQPWGDDWWIAMGQVPARFALEAGLEGITGPSLPEGEPAPEEPPEPKSAEDAPDLNSQFSIRNSEAARLHLWRSWVVTWIGIEKEYSDSLRVFFVRQQRILIKKLKDAFQKTEDRRQKTENGDTHDAIRDTNDDIIARVVFDLKVENEKLRVINHTYFGKASELGIRQALTEVAGLKGEELNKRAAEVKLRAAIKRAMLISSNRITDVNKTTQAMVAMQLKAGLEAGEGLPELTSRLKDVFGSNRTRAQGIARTQTSGAVGTGRHEGFRSSGIELKSWLSARDAHVRPSHVEAESKYAEGIPVDSFFELKGGRVMFPCDPSGPAGEIINCRCVELAKKAGGKGYDLTMQFYSYSDMQRDIAASELKETPNAST
jgi:HK97 family phage portal protein